MNLITKKTEYTLFPDNKIGKYIYLRGGYYSEDSGCPPWGTSDPSEIRFIGDRLGNIRIDFANGNVLSVPLILGWTLWLHSVWNESPAPFFGEYRDSRLSELLYKTLCVFGAYNRAERWSLRIAIPCDEVKSVTVESIDGKCGRPIFDFCYVGEMNLSDEESEFFAGHTVDTKDGCPEEVRASLDIICNALYTFESDFENVPVGFNIPSDGLNYSVRFTDGKYSPIATGNVFCNMKNLDERTEAGGMLHTSYFDAPSWRYDGFGPYIGRANSYYDAFYSRDAGRAIMTLNSYGHKDKAWAVALYGDNLMMTYPKDGVTLGGVPIPGHFSVMPNKPYIYSKLLTKMATPALCDDKEGSTAATWPTRYTRSRFGDEYENLGNQETDGHGLMMMANYLTWCNRGRLVSEALENWEYISEASKWIIWCLDRPELSFAEDNLLYGETEAAMNTYTLYSNIPCYLGLMGYADIAETVGKMDDAVLWREYAAKLHSGIDKILTEGDGWRSERYGFFHDPVLTFMSDIYGYNICDMPEDWVERSKNSYSSDIAKTVRFGWYGAHGIGYDHCMIAQNALLLDKTHDYSKLLESLCKLSYSPRLPEPYIVPEGLTVDSERGILRRQGDLGNLVQLAEAMKCWRIVLGISPVLNGVLTIMPRLPLGWGVSVDNFPLQNASLTINMTVSRVEGNTQQIVYNINGKSTWNRTMIRFGPFDISVKTAIVTLNGNTYFDIPTIRSGDAAWAWVNV